PKSPEGGGTAPEAAARLPAGGAVALVAREQHPQSDQGGPMAVTVKRITLWPADAENQPGALARTLEPLALAGADLRLVMGYRLPHAPERAVIELYPVSGKRAMAAAAQAGLAATADIPCLLVEGDNRPG